MLRAKEREARHMKNDMEKPLIMYSESAASELMQSIRSTSGFHESFQTLAQWLERGECTRRTSSTFYNLLSAVHNHIKRLVKEKKEHEEIVERQKVEQEERAKLMMAQGTAIMKIFQAASKKRCWDHFSKAQRRNIDDWHQQVEKEIKISEEEQLEKREEVGMDLDDDQEHSEIKSEPTSSLVDNEETGEPMAKQAKTESEEATQAALEAQDIKFRAQNASLRALAEKNASLMGEVEGYKKEIVDLKQKFASVFQDKDLQIARLMTAVQGLQNFLQNVTLNTPEINPTDIEVEVDKESKDVSNNTGQTTVEQSSQIQQTSIEQLSSDQNEEPTENEKPPEKVEQKKAKNEGKRGPRTRRRGRKKEKQITEEEVVEEVDNKAETVTDATECSVSLTIDLANPADGDVDNLTKDVSHSQSAYNPGVVRLTSQDMTVVGLLCSYLQVCPYGATTEQVLNHIQRHVPGVTTEGLALILDGLPMIFVGDGLEFYSKTWKFKQVLT
ncbi:ecto-NOX disulfide-thiol exchanger 2 [Exaiptasia diaphana]|nr:ecto-NOX disulfide-thiol exchanger 2 [Exaiptasia diaphana]